MFVPIYDYNPLRHIRTPIVTWALIGLNILVFALQTVGMDEAVSASLGVVPRELFDQGGPIGRFQRRFDAVAIPEPATLLTYMFLHADPLHLASNMIFLWVFGDNVEDALGHWRFLAFYVVAGVVGGLAHSLMLPTSGAPLIGASGAVAGVIAAYLILHPRVQVWVLAFRFIPLKITATLALGAWIATQFVMLFIPDVGPVAWWAHIGGLLAGAVLVVVLRRPGVVLLDRELPKA